MHGLLPPGAHDEPDASPHPQPLLFQGGYEPPTSSPIRSSQQSSSWWLYLSLVRTTLLGTFTTTITFPVVSSSWSTYWDMPCSRVLRLPWQLTIVLDTRPLTTSDEPEETDQPEQPKRLLPAFPKTIHSRLLLDVNYLVAIVILRQLHPPHHLFLLDPGPRQMTNCLDLTRRMPKNAPAGKQSQKSCDDPRMIARFDGTSFAPHQQEHHQRALLNHPEKRNHWTIVMSQLIAVRRDTNDDQHLPISWYTGPASSKKDVLCIHLTFTCDSFRLVIISAVSVLFNLLTFFFLLFQFRFSLRIKGCHCTSFQLSDLIVAPTLHPCPWRPTALNKIIFSASTGTATTTSAFGESPRKCSTTPPLKFFRWPTPSLWTAMGNPARSPVASILAHSDGTTRSGPVS